MDEDVIVEALGLESAFGYHIEPAPGPRIVVDVRDAPAGANYPCLAADGRYTGCLGEACPLRVCWTGAPTVSHAAALLRRFHPGDDAYAPGARCPACRHAAEVRVAVAVGPEVRQMLLLRCARGRWAHPISAPAMARRRIPADAGQDLARCADFAPSDLCPRATPGCDPSLPVAHPKNAEVHDG